MVPLSEFVDTVLENIFELLRNKHNAFSQQGNDEIDNQKKAAADSLIENEDTQDGAVFSEGTREMLNSRGNSKIRSLNEKQRKIFHLVYDCAKSM